MNWLQQWYAQNCDGDWEHSYGVTITTLDNPGWSVTIDLTDTELEGKAFASKVIDRRENDWVRCRIEDTKFLADGGPFNLDEMLQIFIDWADNAAKVELRQI